MLAQLDTGSIVSRSVKWTTVTRPAPANQSWQQWRKPTTRLTCWLGYPLHHNTWTVCHKRDWKNGTWPSSENLGIGKFAQGGCQKCPPQTPNNSKQHLCRILQCNEKHWDASLSRIITGDEAQVQPYNPLTKRQSMELHHQSSSYKKKIKVQTTTAKVMASVFLEREGILLIKFLERGATINPEQYMQTQRS